MLNSDQKKLLEQALKEKVSSIAIYRWCADARKWANMPSEAQLDTTGDILSSIQSTTPDSQNTGDGRLERTVIEVDDDLTPAGEWVLFFTGTERYQVYFRDRDGSSLLRKLS